MDPVQSWLDTNEVRRMAESLMAPPPKVDVSTIDAGYGDGFEGFADATHADSIDPSGVQVPAHQSDGRPHAARQPINPSAPDASVSSAPQGGESVSSREEVSPRAAMGNALADARRVAEGSGMLEGSNTDPAQAVSSQTASNIPIAPEVAVPPQFSPDVHTDPVVSEPIDDLTGSQHDSPFQVSMDQSHLDEVPVARQVSQAMDIQSPAAPPPPAAPPTTPLVTPPPTIDQDPVLLEQSPFDRPEDTVSEPEIEVARGPFLTRLQQFSAILRRELSARSMFLIDNEGQVLLDEVGNPKLIQVARTLANASYRASRQSSGSAAVGNLHVKIGASATLEVVPVQSRYGLLILGVVFPSPIGAERVRQVADLLHKTVEPKS